VSAFVIGSTILSVSCLLFFYIRCPPPRAQRFLKVGARASQCHMISEPLVRGPVANCVEISRFGERFRDGRYSSASETPCPAICKSGGTCPPCPLESAPLKQLDTKQWHNSEHQTHTKKCRRPKKNKCRCYRCIVICQQENRPESTQLATTKHDVRGEATVSGPDLRGPAPLATNRGLTIKPKHIFEGQSFTEREKGGREWTRDP